MSDKAREFKIEHDYKIVYSAQDILSRLRELAKIIDSDYQDQPLTLVAMLKGSLPLLVDLSRYLKKRVMIDVIAVSSINGLQHKGIEVIRDINIDISQQHVLVLEDIVRTGLTTNFMLQHLQQYRPLSLELFTLLFNRQQLLIDLEPRYIGFDIDYTRLVGYGMDYHEYGRDLPFIAKLE